MMNRSPIMISFHVFSRRCRLMVPLFCELSDVFTGG